MFQFLDTSSWDYCFEFSPNTLVQLQNHDFKKEKKKQQPPFLLSLSVATVCWLQGTRTSPASSPFPPGLKLNLVTQSSLTLKRRRQTKGEIQRCTSASAGRPSVRDHWTPVSPKAAGLTWHWEQCWWLVRQTGRSWWWSPGGQFKLPQISTISEYREPSAV